MLNKLGTLPSMTSIRNPSTPKDRTKVLLLEGISDTAASVFDASGYRDVVRLSKALNGDELVAALQDVRIPRHPLAH